MSLSISENIYGEACSIFLNNFLSPQTKYNNIIDSYFKLKTLLIDGQIDFPKVNLELNELIDVTNLIFQNTYTSLLNEEIYGTNYIKTKIYEYTDSDIDFILDDLDSEYKNVVLQLQKIYEVANKNIDNYRLLTYILTNIDKVLRSNTDFNTFDLYNNCFKFFYNKLPLTKSLLLPTDYSDKNLLTIPTLFIIGLLKRILETYTPPSTKILDNLYTYNPTLVTYDYLINSFNKYINIDKFKTDNIAKDLATFISNNIFYFGIKVSNTVFNKLQYCIQQNIINVLPNLVEDNINNIVPSDYVYRICKYSSNNAIISTILNGILYKSSPIWNMDAYTVFTQDHYDKFVQWEDIIAANLYNYLKKNIGLFKQIFDIPLKFTKVPLFLINAYSIVYSKYNLNYLQDVPLFTRNDVSTWLENTLTGSFKQYDKLINYLKTFKLEFNSYDLNFAAFLILQEFSEQLCNLDKFKDFIINTLIPDINKIISNEYKINIDWYQMVDKIIYIFKTILNVDIIKALGTSKLPTADSDPDKLFYDLTNELRMIISPIVVSNSCIINSQQLDSIFNYERNDIDKWFNLFNSFFKSYAVSQYLHQLLKNAYSI